MKNITTIFIRTILGLNLLLAVTTSSAEASYPSVWAWKVTSPTRTIYLIGELHQFEGKDTHVNHTLGLSLHNATSETWIEPIQSEDTSQFDLYEHISIETQHAMESGIRFVVDTNIINDQRDRVFSGLVPLFRKNRPVDAAYGMYMLAASIRNKGFITPIKALSGLGQFLRTSGQINYEKLVDIESKTSMADAWKQNCNNDESADILLTGAAAEITTQSTRSQNLQNIFLLQNEDITSFHNTLTSTPDGKVFDKCLLSPRNHEWLPKILKTLDTSGPPISILVGIGHIGGKNGLIPLLQASRDLKIERIYTPID